jgi:peptide/nickel transport system substrate-binding protein
MDFARSMRGAPVNGHPAMKRREFLQAASAAAISATATVSSFPTSALSRPASSSTATKTLRIIHAADLQSLDPVWTTAPPTKDYAFLTYDQLIAVDADFVPRPQMAEGWAVEDDGRSYVLGLREGLTFHDGEPVRSADCIASIHRWAARDGFGQALARVIETMEAIDDRRFRIRLKRPFPLLTSAIGKSNSSQCFIMPERVARTDPMKQITESIGSGPYRFLKDEWVTGSHAAWAKFDGYRPRREPVSGIAGGRIPAADRVEWSIISDAATAYAALQAGEFDYWDSPTADLVAALKSSPNIVVEVRNTSGSYSMLQFNHLQPPFNNPAVRQAVAMAIDQTVFLQAVVSDPTMMRTCHSFFACGTPYGTEIGADVLKVKDRAKAKAALDAAGYSGEKVVILAVTDSPVLAAMSQVLDDLLRRLGMNVEFVATSFATLAQRRVSKEPVDKGGWSLFITSWTGTDILNPAVNQMLRGGGASGWFGWAEDKTLEDLKIKWFDASDPQEQARLASEIQVEAFKSLPYVPLGSAVSHVAYSKTLVGVFPCPVAAYWNISKSAYRI